MLPKTLPFLDGRQTQCNHGSNHEFLHINCTKGNWNDIISEGALPFFIHKQFHGILIYHFFCSRIVDIFFQVLLVPECTTGSTFLFYQKMLLIILHSIIAVKIFTFIFLIKSYTKKLISLLLFAKTISNTSSIRVSVHLVAILHVYVGGLIFMK